MFGVKGSGFRVWGLGISVRDPDSLSRANGAKLRADHCRGWRFMKKKMEKVGGFRGRVAPARITLRTKMHVRTATSQNCEAVPRRARI